MDTRHVECTVNQVVLPLRNNYVSDLECIFFFPRRSEYVVNPGRTVSIISCQFIQYLIWNFNCVNTLLTKMSYKFQISAVKIMNLSVKPDLITFSYDIIIIIYNVSIDIITQFP